MRKRRITLIVILLLAAFTFGACGKKSDRIFSPDDTSPKNSRNFFFVYSEKTGTTAVKYEQYGKKSELYAFVTGLTGEPVAEADLSEIKGDIYGITFYGTKKEYEILFVNEYAFIEDTGIFLVKDAPWVAFFNNLSVSEDTSYESEGCILPNQRKLAIQDGKWVKDFLNKSVLSDVEPAEGITVSVKRKSNSSDSTGIPTVADLSELDGKLFITNHSENQYTFGTYFQYEVFLDGEWYSMCYTEDPQCYVTYNDIASILKPGGTATDTFRTEGYMKLPEGRYRIVKELWNQTEMDSETNLLYTTAEFIIGE